MYRDTIWIVAGVILILCGIVFLVENVGLKR